MPGSRPDSTPGSLRRRLLGAGIIGLAGSLLPQLTGRVAASPTTTAPPRRPSTGDLALLGFAQSVELAAQKLYEAALATDGLGEKTRLIVAAVRESHQAYAQAINALIGSAAPGTPLAAVVSESAPAFSGSQASIVTAAADFENIAVATHTELLAQLQGTDGAKLIASIIIAEAAHAVAFGDLAGRTDLEQLLTNDAAALVPENV
jgi:rubrerythrin